MKLYLIHTGFYDPKIMDGLYEQHTNFFLVGNNLKEVSKKVRGNVLFKKNKMHIDGIQELNVVEGYRVKLEKDDLIDDTVIYSYDDVKNIIDNTQ